MKRIKLRIRRRELFDKRQKYFEMFRGHETARRCSSCARSAVAWLFTSARSGEKDKSSRRPVCREHLAAERPNI